MNDAMNIAGAVLGAAVGVLQLVILSAVSARMTGVKKGGTSVGVLAALKLAVYLLAIAAVMLFFRENVVSCGIGYAVGMAAAAIIAAVSGRK